MNKKQFIEENQEVLMREFHKEIFGRFVASLIEFKPELADEINSEELTKEFFEKRTKIINYKGDGVSHFLLDDVPLIAFDTVPKFTKYSKAKKSINFEYKYAELWRS